jgi:hypothetical protein
MVQCKVSATEYAIRLNANDLHVGAGEAFTSLPGISLFEDIGGTVSEYFEGDFYELVLVDTDAPSTEDKIEGYLAHKWGLTGSLPIGHPYKILPP